MNIEDLTTIEKLNDAFYECMKVSRWKDSTQRYMCNLLQNNLELQQDLRNGTYRTEAPIRFTLHERGKMRDIEAPTMRDRVVHKVLVKHVLMPQLRPLLIYDNYASLSERGTSMARKRIDVMLQKFLREYGPDGYILQIDIKKYFGSIDHTVLKGLLHKRFKNESKDVLSLIDYIVDTSSSTGKGLNLGSEAPQIFAIFYLSVLDNFIKIVKGIKFYGRYMDDMFVIAENKEELQSLLEEIKLQLESLKLQINEKKTHITKLSHGFTFLQIKYNIVGNKILKRLTRAKITRERKRLKAFKRLLDEGKMAENDIYNCYQSWKNSAIKDCNACYTSIHSLDILYKELFPVHKEVSKLSRRKLIEEVYADAESEDVKISYSERITLVP